MSKKDYQNYEIRGFRYDELYEKYKNTTDKKEEKSKDKIDTNKEDNK